MSQPPSAGEPLSALGTPHECLEEYENRATKLGSLDISRALPVRGRRLVGPWCFLDRFGPLSFTTGRPMDVAPHPHIGLQTVTWLLAGEVLHDDSLGHRALLREGGVNVMTSGDAIAHAERTPDSHGGRLHGVQLWAALPEAHRRTTPAFEHVPEVPQLELPGGLVQVFSGTVGNAASPARHFSELVGADLRVHRAASLTVPLQPRFEHALLLLHGDCTLRGQALAERVLYYLGTQRAEVALDSAGGARVLLLGGVPFGETVLMWWNFVARTPEEIRAARADWEERRRFGEVPGHPGPRLIAPELVRLAWPEPMS